jgi:hypothetical protein
MMSTSSIERISLFQRLSEIRGQLDLILSELNGICASCPKDADKHLRDLHEQFMFAVHHLELTLDYLMPLEDQRDRLLPFKVRE